MEPRMNRWRFVLGDEIQQPRHFLSVNPALLETHAQQHMPSGRRWQSRWGGPVGFARLNLLDLLVRADAHVKTSLLVVFGSRFASAQGTPRGTLRGAARPIGLGEKGLHPCVIF